MKWSQKRILLCICAFVILFGVLLGKAFVGKERETRPATYATEEDLVVYVPPVSGDGATIKPQQKPTVTSASTIKDKRNTPQPHVTPSTIRKKENAGKKDKKQDTKEKKSVKKQSLDKVREKENAKLPGTSKVPVTNPPANLPQPTAREEKECVSLEIQCVNIMDKKELWRDGLEEILPSNGIFYQGQLENKKEDTVYDLMKRVCKENNIALDAEYTPLYGTYYIKGIGNLYEFDCGNESGWKYTVNGVLPGVGCSSYTVKTGDKIVFYYDYQY